MTALFRLKMLIYRDKTINGKRVKKPGLDISAELTAFSKIHHYIYTQYNLLNNEIKIRLYYRIKS